MRENPIHDFVLWSYIDYVDRSIVGPKPALSFDDEMRAYGLTWDDVEEQ